MAIRFCANPPIAPGRSITSRGGESSAWIAGTTGRVERISTTGTPRACTIRTLLTTAGRLTTCSFEPAASPGAGFCAVTNPASARAAHTSWSADRDKDKDIPWKQL